MMEIRRSDDRDGDEAVAPGGEGDSRFQTEQKALRRAPKMTVCVTVFM